MVGALSILCLFWGENGGLHVVFVGSSLEMVGFLSVSWFSVEK